MAELTQEQKQQVARWAKEGARLADIQKRIREELGISMTYMDARLLVIELGLELKDVARPAAKSPAPAPAPMPPPVPGRGGRAPAADVADSDEAADWGADEPQGGAGPGAVQVDVDRIMKPGSLVSGTVKFSDGTNATWALDQFGRLALGGTGPGYKPSQQDIMEFQVQLRKLLETRGF
jgi:hypothetical protein